jgi:ketosteroid isomerase-like protein
MYADQQSAESGALTTAEFRALMQTVADGWNAGDARRAADCFTENAVYTEPPERQVYVGREALYDFFGGAAGPDLPMSMEWHHLLFDEDTQIGAGEYTFAMHNRYHGVVIVRIAEGKIANWREYQYRSERDWAAFLGPNPF